jgi:hypothetical protein
MILEDAFWTVLNIVTKIPGRTGSWVEERGRGSRLCKIVVRGGYAPLEREF